MYLSLSVCLCDLIIIFNFTAPRTHRSIYIVVALCTLSVCMLLQYSCLWSMMHGDVHTTLLLYIVLIAVYQTHTVCVCITASLGCHLKIEFFGRRDIPSCPPTPTLADLVQSYPALYDALRFGQYDQSSGTSMSTS